MKKIKLMNKIAAVGTDNFDRAVYEVSDTLENPDAIMVRSAALHDMEMNPELKAIARCGAGVNNIPVEKCTEKGIVVFNTPGANANGVKELAICALLLAARDVVGGIDWAKTLTTDVAKLVYEWILGLGGLDVMKEMNAKKAALLYDYLDTQDYYIAPVKKDSRSMMNVTFVTGDADLDKKFASEAAKAGLKNLKGHRSVGGMRASIYNAMPYAGVEALVAFMKKFAAENPKK